MGIAPSLSPISTSTPQLLTIELTTPVDDKRPVYIVGNFNNWNVDQERFRLTRLAQGKFIFTFPQNFTFPTKLEYKYVRGGWENQEIDEFGNAIHNRVLENFSGTVRDFVPRWSNYGLNFNPAFLPKIEVINSSFYIPQLHKYRKVSILLPFDYDKNPQKRYPVLYLHDAQNLFNPRSPYGNWGIDHKLAILAEKGMGDLIVVAVDHGETDRVTEFLPIKHDKLGASEGRKYVKFIAETLKSYVDTHYRTLPSRSHTGMGGSSMGGLITAYGGLMFPEVFGKLMIFSPSLWVTRHSPFESVPFIQPILTRIYIYAGGKEGSNMIPNVKNFQDNIKNKGLDNSNLHFKLSVDLEGIHSEVRWGQEFPKAIEWLFFS